MRPEVVRPDVRALKGPGPGRTFGGDLDAVRTGPDVRTSRPDLGKQSGVVHDVAVP